MAETPEAREIMQRIIEYSRRLRALGLSQPPYTYRAELARLWEEYIRLLPRDVAMREAIAILGYPQVVPLIEVPRRIMEDPVFARLLIETYGV